MSKKLIKRKNRDEHIITTHVLAYAHIRTCRHIANKMYVITFVSPYRLLNTGLFLDKMYTPLLCLFGSLGNALSLSVFCLESKYRSQSSSYYLSALAISDTGFLLNLFAVWLEGIRGGVITSDVMCPLVMYLGQVTCFISVYLMVAFSIERYVAVHYPFSRPRICTKSKAKKLILAIVVTSLVLFSYAFVIAKVISLKPQISDENGMSSLSVNMTQEKNSAETNGPPPDLQMTGLHNTKLDYFHWEKYGNSMNNTDTIGK